MLEQLDMSLRYLAGWGEQTIDTTRNKLVAAQENKTERHTERSICLLLQDGRYLTMQLPATEYGPLFVKQISFVFDLDLICWSRDLKLMELILTLAASTL